ncbi:hypothetical protein mRhiFer1_010266 [Rhinolophus ferrumequinum]|uniref:Uncharacterized protein n=1 Tax=Rhinolophus ferrumequinum TaxID=59479 RepID=A0A7J7X6F7_RHIFE|nr:hypothetical protein mRhiFer1_010266 [Rhinolophus ferrumequinum]
MVAHGNPEHTVAHSTLSSPRQPGAVHCSPAPGRAVVHNLSCRGRSSPAHVGIQPATLALGARLSNHLSHWLVLVYSYNHQIAFQLSPLFNSDMPAGDCSLCAPQIPQTQSEIELPHLSPVFFFLILFFFCFFNFIYLRVFFQDPSAPSQVVVSI